VSAVNGFTEKELEFIINLDITYGQGDAIGRWGDSGADLGNFDNLSRDRWHALVEANRKLIAIFEGENQSKSGRELGEQPRQRIGKMTHKMFKY
jgi:hypothetical protein